MILRVASCCLLALVGCAIGCATPGPVEVRVAPPLEPPPPAGRPLAREEALQVVRRTGPDEAIAELDRRPFGFALDEGDLQWFRAQDLPAPVLDYLTKRSRVDWEALRTGPDGPP